MIFNVSNSFKPLVSDVELLTATHDAIDETIKLLLARFSPNKNVDVDSITSKTNVQLSFKKFLHGHKSDYNFYNIDWLRGVYRISEIDDKKQIKLDDLLPNSVLTEVKLTSSLSIHFAFALRLFFYVLYCRKVILLSPNYSPARTFVNNIPFDTTFHLYPTLLRLVRQDFFTPYEYGQAIQNEKRPILPSILKSLGKTEVNNVRANAYRIFICTQWYDVKDITPEDIIKFSRACYITTKTSPEIISKALPLVSVLKALLSIFPNDCLFTHKDIKSLGDVNRNKTIVNYATAKKREDIQSEVLRFNTSEHIDYLVNDKIISEQCELVIKELATWQKTEGNERLYLALDALQQQDLNQNWLQLAFSTYDDGFVRLKNFKQLLGVEERKQIPFTVSKQDLFCFREIIGILFYALQRNRIVTLPLGFGLKHRKRRFLAVPDTFYSNLINYFRLDSQASTTLRNIITKDLLDDFSRYVVPFFASTNITNLSELTPASIRHLFDITKKISNKRQITTVAHALKALLDSVGNLCHYSASDLGIFMIPNKQLHFSVLEEHTDLYESSITQSWLHYQKLYIASLKRRGMSSFKTVEKNLGRFNRYLFVDLATEVGIENIPLTPSNLKRSHISGTETFPGFMDRQINELKAESAYQVIKHVEQFFEWLYSFKKEDDVIGFINPINKLDYPKLTRSKGTNKKIFPRESFMNMHSFVFSLCEFYWYLIERDLYSPDNAKRKSCFSTEELGFVPIFYLNGKLHYIKHIPTDLTTEKLSVKNGKEYFYPTFQGLFQCLVALETGLRHIHIRWLSLDNFNLYLDDNEGSIGQLTIHDTSSHILNVNTDKTKRAPWKSIVSHRVILTLQRLKRFLDSVDQDIPPIWYNNNEHSPYGKIRSLFALPSQSEEIAPYSESSFQLIYKRLQFFFDLFVIQNAPGVNTLNGLPEILNDRYVSCLEKHMSTHDILAELFYYSGSYSTEFTPHGTRSSVASERVKMLPPWVVAEYITGHESLAVFAHYVQVDPDFIRNAGNYSKDYLLQKELFGNSAKLDIITEGEQVINALKLVIQQDPTLLESQFGAVSFSTEVSTSKYASGMNLIYSTPVSNLSFMSTHICPFNSVCPDDIKKDFGEMRCGPCYYSIKTVDHIPRILAEIRKLLDDLSTIQTTIREAKDAGADVTGLRNLEKQKQDVAMDLSAWIHTYEILRVNLEKLKREEKAEKTFLVAKPDILLNKLEEVNVKDTALNNLLLRLKDAGRYQEYFTPQLKAKLTHLKNRILINTGQLEKLLEDIPSYQLVDELRGLITSFCTYENIPLSDALERLMSDFETPNTEFKLLEVAK